jgi:hypothetical protein
MGLALLQNGASWRRFGVRKSSFGGEAAYLQTVPAGRRLEQGRIFGRIYVNIR